MKKEQNVKRKAEGRFSAAPLLDHTVLVKALQKNSDRIMVNITERGLALWDALNAAGIRATPVRVMKGKIMRVANSAESPQAPNQ